MEGKQRSKQTRISSLNLTNVLGIKHNVQAIGLKYMAEIRKLSGVFTKAEDEARSSFNRSDGRIDVLLCMASIAMHYRDQHEAGLLMLNKIRFSPGRVMTGRQPARDRRKA